MKKIVVNGLRDFTYRAECPICHCIFDFMEVDFTYLVEFSQKVVQCPSCEAFIGGWRKKGKLNEK